jgi:hypothetical protein
VQNEILAKDPGRSLRVYAVWFAVVPGDERSKWPRGLLDDPRVTDLWDEEYKVGRYFGGRPELRDRGLMVRGIMWDTYLLFGPQSRWDEAPTRLVGAGFTISDTREQLRRDLQSLATAR